MKLEELFLGDHGAIDRHIHDALKNLNKHKDHEDPKIATIAKNAIESLTNFNKHPTQIYSDSHSVVVALNQLKRPITATNRHMIQNAADTFDSYDGTG